MKAKRILPLLLIIAASGLVSCSIKIDNMTPAKVPANPSGIYTLSARPNISNEAVDPGSLALHVIIDGKKHSMLPSDIGSNYYDFDYAIPDGRNNARFYYEMQYRMRNFGDKPSPLKEFSSEVYQFELIDRYSITLDTERAPIGSRIAILGRGFRQGDTVYVDNVAANTRFVSSNVLEFIVPGVGSGRAYPVAVHGGKDIQPAGILRVDPGNPLSVLPQSLELAQGQRQALAFVLDYKASIGGLEILVTTDIPDSIIMPELFIPEGARTVSIPVEGGTPGRGTLYVKGTGLPELKIPVTVR
ncbi:MAG: hypothetical protein ACI81V_000741 [Lentimonas sp.]|jgi:hypothetical protein